MGFDQKGFLVFRVNHGRSGKWNVLQVGVTKPLASFGTQKEATEYVHGLVNTINVLRPEIFIRGAQMAEADTTDSPCRE